MILRVRKRVQGEFYVGSTKRLIFTVKPTVASLLLSACSSSPSILQPSGTDAIRVANLFWLMLGIAVIVMGAISVLLTASAVKARRALNGGEAFAQDDRRTLMWVIVGGAVIPAIVLLVLMALGISIENAANAKPDTSITLQVIGHQWWWEVRYPEQNIVTANEIHIPVGQETTIKVTSADVIHSFWVPELHGKIDLIPGQTNTITLETDKPGIYRGQCAEFCGDQHAHMAFYVVVNGRDEFNAWLADQSKPAPDPAVGSLEEKGLQAFLGSDCVFCHTIQGTNASGKSDRT